MSGVSNYYMLLTYVTEPEGKRFGFKYSRFLKNCTPDGSMVFYKAYYSYDDIKGEDEYKTLEHNYKYFVDDIIEYDEQFGDGAVFVTFFSFEIAQFLPRP